MRTAPATGAEHQERVGTRRGSAGELRRFVEASLRDFPWQVVVTDWTGQTYAAGGNSPHFCDQPMRVNVKTEAAARTVLSLDGMGYLEHFLAGNVDIEGNLYLLAPSYFRGRVELKPWYLMDRLLRKVAFQDKGRARANVKSHYDIPQEALNVYLDQVYMSYSCAMFENPDDLHLEGLLRVGQGQTDTFDSLEKAQWRKFKDAVDYIAPAPGETLLDVGCGYGGQLQVALENHPFGKVVGYTLSHNQVEEGSKLLQKFERDRWELNEGDYRDDRRVYDHITSTGMFSHVGPRGLIPYVKNVRRRIKTGGRYLHHDLMTAYHRVPLDFQVGVAFNKKYVWPGFHWFTLGEHTRALEKNGFQVERAVSLRKHYAKTAACWYERMMANEQVTVEKLGRPTLRAWQVFLAGVVGGLLEREAHDYRLYCTAV